MSNERRSYHHGDLRSALLAAATEMVAEGGVESVTMRELSQRIGVSRTAPYRHFEDKAALLAAVAEAGFQEMTVAMESVRQRLPDADALTVLQSMGHAYVRFALANPARYRVMFGENAVSFDDNPRVASAGRTAYRTLYNALAQAQADGLVIVGDTRQLTYHFWSSGHGNALLMIDGHVRVHDLAQYTALVMTALTTGIAAGRRDLDTDMAEY